MVDVEKQILFDPSKSLKILYLIDRNGNLKYEARSNLSKEVVNLNSDKWYVLVETSKDKRGKVSNSSKIKFLSQNFVDKQEFYNWLVQKSDIQPEQTNFEYISNLVLNRIIT